MAIQENSLRDRIMTYLVEEGFNPNEEFTLRFANAIAKAVKWEIFHNAECYGGEGVTAFAGKVK